jgi:hypothetical protein
VTLREAAPASRAMVVAVMVSMVAFLDSTVINLALPATEHDLGGGLALQQWVRNQALDRGRTIASAVIVHPLKSTRPGPSSWPTPSECRPR